MLVTHQKYHCGNPNSPRIQAYQLVLSGFMWCDSGGRHSLQHTTNKVRRKAKFAKRKLRTLSNGAADTKEQNGQIAQHTNSGASLSAKVLTLRGYRWRH